MIKRMKPYQLWQLIVATAKELIREPGVIFWGIVFPVLMAFGLGIAFTKKTLTVRKIAVITPESTDRSSISYFPFHEFLNRHGERNPAPATDDYSWKVYIKDDKLGDYEFLFYEMDHNTAMMLLKRGTVNIIIDDTGGETEYHFDPLNSDAHLTYLKISDLAGAGKGTAVTVDKSEGKVKPLTLSGTRYIDFLVPGLITMGVMMSCMWGISYTIIEKRSKKLLRRMIATPMRKSHFLIALITVRLALNFIESSVLYLFAFLVFDVRIQGSFPALLTVFIAGNIAFAGIAVFVSSHTSNTEVGNGLINFVVLPMMVLSGIFFSYHNFPDWSIPVIQKLPLTILTDGVRSIFNEGSGFSLIAMPSMILTATGLIFFAAGLKIFKWH